MRLRFAVCVGALLLGAAGSAHDAVIDFTGGSVYLIGGGTGTTNNSVVYQGVDYYEENGFRLDFIGPGTDPFESIVGDYYVAGNDVIHGHWDTGLYGGLTEIRVTKTDGTAFDLNYFILTSNTDAGGAPASGNERTYINALQDGTNISYSMLLPPDDWGFGGVNPQVYLDNNFDGILAFTYTVANRVDCFGMDNFYIDEAPPPAPEPSTLILFGTGLLAAARASRRAKK